MQVMNCVAYSLMNEKGLFNTYKYLLNLQDRV